MGETRDPQAGHQESVQESSEEKPEELETLSEAPISLEEMKDLIEQAEKKKGDLEGAMQDLEEAIGAFDAILVRVEESNRKKPTSMNGPDYTRWLAERRDLITLYYSRRGVLKATFSILARRAREAGLKDWGLKFTTLKEIEQWSLRVQYNKKIKANRDIEPEQQEEDEI